MLSVTIFADDRPPVKWLRTEVTSDAALSTTKHPSGWAATERSIIAFTSRGIAVSVFRKKGLFPETTETMERVSFYRALQARVWLREIEVTENK